LISHFADSGGGLLVGSNLPDGSSPVRLIGAASKLRRRQLRRGRDLPREPLRHHAVNLTASDFICQRPAMRGNQRLAVIEGYRNADETSAFGHDGVPKSR